MGDAECRATRKRGGRGRQRPHATRSFRVHEQIPSFLDFSGKIGMVKGRLWWVIRGGVRARVCRGCPFGSAPFSALPSTPVARSPSLVGQVWPIFPKGKVKERGSGERDRFIRTTPTTNSSALPSRATAAMAACATEVQERRVKGEFVRLVTSLEPKSARRVFQRFSRAQSLTQYLEISIWIKSEYYRKSERDDQLLLANVFLVRKNWVVVLNVETNIQYQFEVMSVKSKTNQKCTHVWIRCKYDCLQQKLIQYRVWTIIAKIYEIIDTLAACWRAKQFRESLSWLKLEIVVSGCRLIPTEEGCHQFAFGHFSASLNLFSRGSRITRQTQRQTFLLRGEEKEREWEREKNIVREPRVAATTADGV